MTEVAIGVEGDSLRFDAVEWPVSARRPGAAARDGQPRAIRP
jgi:hypothetical protein